MPAVSPGSQLGPYRIESLLGVGGMGEVWRAKDTRLDRSVAVKLLPEALATDPERRQRLEHEARAVAALNHPGIVGVYDVSPPDGATAYIVSELVKGVPLAELLREGPLSPRRIADLGAQIADALAAAHDAGIVHRDLKPANIMVTPEGRVKVLDFGLAKLATKAAGAGVTATLSGVDTAPGTILGTVSYMSPEQVRAQPLDARSDIFSLGIILHELVTGARPFERSSGVETLNAILKEEPGELPESVPHLLRQVINRCLAKNPSGRFQSASDLAFALRTATEMRAALPAASPRRWPWFASAAALLMIGTLAYAFYPRGEVSPVGRRTMRQLTFDSGLTTDPTLSTDGKLIAYSSDRAGNAGLDIWLQHLAGGAAIRLTQDLAHESEPDISPDGGRIAFTSTREGGGIYVVPILGGEPRLLAKGGRRPRFSPDGRQIAYWTGTSGAALGTTKRDV